MSESENKPQVDPYAGAKGLRAATLGQEGDTFTGIPTVDGNVINILKGNDGHTYIDLGVVGSPLLDRITTPGHPLGLPTAADVPDRYNYTTLACVRRDIYPFLNPAQQAVAKERQKQALARLNLQPTREPHVWGGDTVVTLKDGSCVRMSLDIQLVKPRKRNGDTEESGDANAGEAAGDKAVDDAIGHIEGGGPG